MKKLLFMALFAGLFTSCISEYAAKDKDGSLIIIKDFNGVMKDAISLGLDSITVVKYDRDEFYRPLRYMGKNENTFHSDTLSNGNGRKIAWTNKYRVIYLSNVVKR